MLRIRMLAVAALGSLLLMASVAAAGTLAKGSTELMGSAGFSSYSISGSSNSVTVVSTELGYGFCLTNNWEILPAASIQSLSAGGHTASTLSGIVSAVYNFATASGTAVPYLQAGVGLGSESSGGSSISSSILPLVGGGVRFLVGNSAAVNLGATYRRDTWTNHGESLTQSTTGVQAGLSIFPKGFGGK